MAGLSALDWLFVGFAFFIRIVLIAHFAWRKRRFATRRCAGGGWCTRWGWALCLAMQMFYWWPVGTLWRPLWYAYAALFALSTWLNVTSHRPADRRRRAHA